MRTRLCVLRAWTRVACLPHFYSDSRQGMRWNKCWRRSRSSSMWRAQGRKGREESKCVATMWEVSLAIQAKRRQKTRAIRGRCLHRMLSPVREAPNAGFISNLLLT
ncbi:hypothetical protein Naga_100112g6 [Nannochloropsis gaditana]|uniref:Uncharacterized protein n=1 Tax=Nannochloropsis gaditana TaxID=72520 RepID=W7TU37_9STRA|nr:hypothetical protein Naga_100112g6 [Nannochloropsis gaditana]